MKKISVMILMILMIFVGILSAQDSEASTGIDPAEQSEFVPGFIFNTNNLLLDFESYMGGIGVKLLYPDYALRLMVGAEYQTSTVNKLNLSLGFAFEKPFFKTKISPYAGVSTIIDFTQELNIIDESNWTQTMTLASGVGGVLGVEVFLTDFLSFFAEYELLANVAWTRLSTSTDDIIGIPTDAVNYNIVTDLGNSGMLGVVIYLKTTGILPITYE